MAVEVHTAAMRRAIDVEERRTRATEPWRSSSIASGRNFASTVRYGAPIDNNNPCWVNNPARCVAGLSLHYTGWWNKWTGGVFGATTAGAGGSSAVATGRFVSMYWCTSSALPEIVTKQRSGFNAYKDCRSVIITSQVLDPRKTTLSQANSFPAYCEGGSKQSSA